MTIKGAVILALLMTAGDGRVAAAQSRDVLVRFDGAIGVMPAQNVGTQNVVRGVNPGNGPWRIADLKAVVDVYGGITIRGKGLLVASGNRIGTNLGQSVFATLICEAAEPFVELSTVAVPLQPNGDFRIDDSLRSVPAECENGVLLIRSAQGKAWFAAGIPDLGGDD